MNNYYNMMGAGMPWGRGFSFLWFILLAWSLVWKGFALYRAARREDKAWYVVLLILNTAGILDILYLYIFGKDKDKTPPAHKPSVPDVKSV